MSTDSTGETGESTTLDAYVPEPPWYTLLASGDAPDEKWDNTEHVVEATNYLHKHGKYGEARLFDDVDKTIKGIINRLREPTEFAGARGWMVDPKRRSVDTVAEKVIRYTIEHDINILVVDHPTTLGTTAQKIADRLTWLGEAGIELHIAQTRSRVAGADREVLAGVLESIDRDGVKLHQRHIHLGLAEETETSQADKAVGRPGLGLTIEDGERVPGPEYDKVCEILQRVALHESYQFSMSKRQGAKELGCARKTISRALNRPEQYDLSGEWSPEETRKANRRDDIPR